MDEAGSVIDPNPRAIRNQRVSSAQVALSVIDPNPRAIRNQGTDA